MEALTTLQDEIKYSTGVKSRPAGLAGGLKYIEIQPIGSSSSEVNGSNFLFNFADSVSALDTSRSEVLFDVKAEWTSATGAVYPEGSSAFFRNAIVRSVASGAELCRVSNYNKLSAVFRRAKLPAGGSLTKEGGAKMSGPTIGETTTVGAAYVSGLKIADAEFATITNAHRAFASGTPYQMSMPFRGLGALSLTSGEHGKYFPLFAAPLQLELQMESNPAECIYSTADTAGLKITISNIRCKLALIEYDPQFINTMKQSMAAAGGLLLSVPRWRVDQFSSASGSLNFQVGLVAQSLRMVAVINDYANELNVSSYAHLSLSPSMAVSQFYLQINGAQFPNRSLNNPVQQMTYAEEALGGFANSIDLTKYGYASTTDVNVLIPGNATYSTAVIPPTNILAIDCDAAPNAKTLNGKPTGVALNVNIERTADAGNRTRNFYVCSYYDTILQINPNDGSITEVQ